MSSAPRSVLLAWTGLDLDGGIASVNRASLRALEEEVAAGRIRRLDRVLLHDRVPYSPPPASGTELLARGSQPRFALQLWSLYRRHRHDLVYFDHIGLARVMRLPLPSLRSARYRIFVHGGELVAAGSGSRARAVLGAERLLTNSAFTAARVRQLYGDRTPPEQVVDLCIDPLRIERWEALPPRQGAALERAPAALIVGRMMFEERGKGHDHLLEAWNRVLEDVPGAQLWIVGGGVDRARLEARASELSLGPHVRFLGRVSDEELVDLYARASVFAMPSRQEGFGLVYAEAMWHGLPCIGSDADAAPGVICDGETGLIVPYGDVQRLADAVVRLLTDPEAVRRMGEAGRRLARERFSYEAFRERFLAGLATGRAPAACGRDD